MRKYQTFAFYIINITTETSIIWYYFEDGISHLKRLNQNDFRALIVMMEIDTEEKKRFVMDFLKSMKKNPDFIELSYFDPLAYGFFDYQFITKNSMYSIDKIQEYMKTQRSISFANFKNLLERMFTAIRDYLLENDPLQVKYQIGLICIQNFEIEFHNKFYGSAEESAPRPSFSDQIEMAYFLKNFEENEEALKEMGKKWGIVSETKDELIFDLGKGSWLDFLRQRRKQ